MHRSLLEAEKLLAENGLSGLLTLKACDSALKGKILQRCPHFEVLRRIMMSTPSQEQSRRKQDTPQVLPRTTEPSIASYTVITMESSEEESQASDDDEGFEILGVKQEESLAVSRTLPVTVVQRDSSTLDAMEQVSLEERRACY